MKDGEIIQSKFKRGDRVELNHRTLEAFSTSDDLSYLPTFGAMYLPTNPEDPVRYSPLRGFEANGRNWPMEGSLGWVLWHREFPTQSKTSALAEWGLEINVDGKTLIVTENCLTAFP